jgi:hypothetical protein
VTADPPTDPRVEHARQVLAEYDKGHWTGEANLIGHLAGAVRQLLTLIDDYEDEERLLATTYVTPSGGAHITPADVEVLGQALDDADAGTLAAIRAVLARFDWEFDDRQYALEEIQRIAGGEDQ